METDHAQLKGYHDISMRLRFLKGFSPVALTYFIDHIMTQLAALGLAPKPFPVTKGTLMAPDILSSGAFALTRDKDCACVCVLVQHVSSS